MNELLTWLPFLVKAVGPVPAAIIITIVFVAMTLGGADVKNRRQTKWEKEYKFPGDDNAGA